MATGASSGVTKTIFTTLGVRYGTGICWRPYRLMGVVMEILILAVLGLVLILTVAVVVLKLLIALVLIPFKLLGRHFGRRRQARRGRGSSVRRSRRSSPAPRPRTRRHRLGRRGSASLLVLAASSRSIGALLAKLQDERQPPERVFPAHDSGQNAAAHNRKTVIV